MLFKMDEQQVQKLEETVRRLEAQIENLELKTRILAKKILELMKQNPNYPDIWRLLDE